MRLAGMDKRLRALERKISINPLPPFVVCGENESGAAELLLINWWENGVSKSWQPDGEDLPAALQAQMRQYCPELCHAFGAT